MVKNHLKRINAPKTWPISRKENTWITRPNPGTHKLEESMSINTILKDFLNYVKITKEVKKILNNRDILVNKKQIDNIKYPVGILDIIEIPKTKEYFLFLLNKRGKFFLQKIDSKKAEEKYLKIINKTLLKKNKLQINFHNGENLLIENKDYKVGDTLLINLKTKKIIKHLKLEKGSTVYIKGGKYVGSTGTIERLISSNKLKNDMLELKIDNKKVKTLKRFVFVINKDYIK